MNHMYIRRYAKKSVSLPIYSIIRIMSRSIVSIIALFICHILSAQTAGDSIAIADAKWVTDTVARGVVLRIGCFENLYGAPQNVVCIEVDPTVRAVGIGVNSPVDYTNTSAAAMNSLAAVNGSFFDMRRGNSVCYLKKDDEVCDTTRNGDSKLNGAVIIENGAMLVQRWDRAVEKDYADEYPDRDVLVSGPILIENGAMADIPSRKGAFSTTHHPRTGVAVRADGKILLVTADGRQPGVAEGMSLDSFAHLFKCLGATDALNLDGGGSTTAWVSHLPYGGVVNKPSGKRLRRVANIIYVY